MGVKRGFRVGQKVWFVYSGKLLSGRIVERDEIRHRVVVKSKANLYESSQYVLYATELKEVK